MARLVAALVRLETWLAGRIRAGHPALPFVPIFIAGAVCAGLLQIALFLRPGPFGTPYVMDPWRYLPLGVFYEFYGTGLAIAPFLLLAVLARSASWRRGLTAGGAGVVGILLVIGHVNHELQRFMGIRLSAGFVSLYGKVEGTPPAIFQALADDKGGAWLSIILLAIPLALYPAMVIWGLRTRERKYAHRAYLAAGASGLLICVLAALAWNFAVKGKNRLDKIAPAIIAVTRDLGYEMRRRPVDPVQIAKDARQFQSQWLAAEGSRDWTFPDSRYPYWRTCGKPAAASSRRPNVILIVIETMRARNMRSFLPSARQAPTPFLDALAAAPGSAIWTRYYANGVPTAPAMLTINTSVPPPGVWQFSVSAARAHYGGFAGILRDNGYRTVTYAVGDPDWDNQTRWLRKWYDEIHFDPHARKVDREIFRRMARRLSVLGREERPFLAMIKSYSNHLPFRSPEARFADNKATRLTERINAGLRYSDDVIREFHQTIAKEPWFRDTIFIVTGDHGYDLGDRGVALGHTNLRHETTWVPLIMHREAGLPLRGRQETVGSHVDLGPTILGLAGICPDIASPGHNLFTVRPERASALIVKEGNVALETQGYGLYLPAAGKPMLYRGTDLLQQDDIATKEPAIVKALSDRARMLMRLNDALVETDRILPP